jgi:vacuolar protein sorting-associated protein 35
VSGPYGNGGPTTTTTAPMSAQPQQQQQGDDQQARFLRDALAQVRRAGELVRRAADQGNLREALRYSAAMLGELRTGYLGPQQYYELYVAVGDELESLAQFLRDETEAAAAAGAASSAAPSLTTSASGTLRPTPPRSAAELYEAVQHAGNVLPRLYLMVLAGALLARTGTGSGGAGGGATNPPNNPQPPAAIRARDVLFDLAEMAKGVQHPLRGLFLRAFLCQQARPVLSPPPPPPATTATTNLPPPPPPPSVEDAVDFLLANFVESNKLWVRMQHQAQAAAAAAAARVGSAGAGTGGAFNATTSNPAADRERERREQERAQLRDLVGKNLTQLAQLDGLDFALYKRAVLPRLLEQVVSCRDALAQGYLMQVLVQCFPDPWHVGTLDALLGVLPELQPGVRLAAVVASLADRLARFAAADNGGGEGGVGGGGGAAAAGLRESGALERLSNAVARASAAHGGRGASAAAVAEMHASLAAFARALHPAAAAGEASSRVVDRVLRDCRAALLARAGAQAQVVEAGAQQQQQPQTPDLSAAAAAAVAADPAAERALSALLSDAAGRLSLPAALEGLPSLPPLAALLPRRAARALAARVANAALEQLGGCAGGGGGGGAGAADATAASADAGASTSASSSALRSPDMADRLLVFVSPLLGSPSPEAQPDDDDELEADVLLAARLIHALVQPPPPPAAAADAADAPPSSSLDAATSAFAALKRCRPHVERAPSRRARLILLPTLAFGALRLVRALLSPSSPSSSAAAAKAEEQDQRRAAAQEALQWTLELALAVSADAQAPLDAAAALLGAGLSSAAAAIPPPSAQDAAAAEAAAVTALRILLAGAAAASEELRSEPLAYEFAEQALTLYEEAGVASSARHRGAALQAIVGTLHRCRAFGRESRETLSQSAVGYAGKLLHRADQCRAVCAAAHLAWQEQEDEGEEGAGDDGQQQQQQQQRYPPCRDAAKVMAALKRALKVAQAAKQQRVLGAAAAASGGGGGFDGGSGGGGVGGPAAAAPVVSAAQAAHAAQAALASATYLGLAVTILNKYLYFYTRGVDGVSAGAVQQLLETVAAEVAEGGAGAGAGAGANAAAAAALAAAAAAGGPAAAVAAAATRADAEARRFWAATLAHVAHQQRLERERGGGEGAPFSALKLPAPGSTPLPASPLS